MNGGMIMIAPKLFSYSIPASSHIGLEAITPLTVVPGIIPTAIGIVVAAKPIMNAVNRLIQESSNTDGVKKGVQTMADGVNMVCSFIGK